MQIISFSDEAISRIRDLKNSKEYRDKTLRVSLSKRGCSGMSYQYDFVNETLPNDEIINEQDLQIAIASDALMFIIGSRLDYRYEKFFNGFVFDNPNVKSVCGCGESFNV